MNLSEICIEFSKLGFGGSVPDTIDGQAFHEMFLMCGYFNDAAEYLKPGVEEAVVTFAEAMLPEARRISEEIGLQAVMLESRTETARLDLVRWYSKLAAFNGGEVVFFECPRGEQGRQIESRTEILSVIGAIEKVIENGGKWW